MIIDDDEMALLSSLLKVSCVGCLYVCEYIGY